MDLLERQSPLAELARYAQEAREGHGRLVLLAGEAGVGKTALAEQLQQDLPGACWSWGACDGLFTPQPLGPLFDLASQLDGELAGRSRTTAASTGAPGRFRSRSRKRSSWAGCPGGRSR